jgi:hypothetical protein
VTQLLHERAADETRGSRDEDSHRGRVYWRVCALLAAGLVVGGCHGSGSKRPAPKPPAPKLSFRVLDAQEQRLVADYEPVSRALTGYEVAYRDWRAGRLAASALTVRASAFRMVVSRAIARIRSDRAIGGNARAKAILVAGLEARRRALGAPPDGARYRSDWDRSVIAARRALTLMQDLRDRARLIPLPEDAVS